MNSPTQWTYSLRDISGNQTTGTANVVTLSTKYRITAAAKQFFIFFFIALAFLPVPFLHFLFVPLFLITAFVRGGMALAGRQLITEFNAICPSCSKPLQWRNLKPKQSWREGCNHCRVVLTIERQSQS